MTDFDKEYLRQATFMARRMRRDATLRGYGIDPADFKEWQRESEVGNECDTDEYRETQPAKGLGYIADFLNDWAPGIPAMYEMFDLLKKWINSGANMGEAYSGADALVPIMEMCFDFIWEQGGWSLYQGLDDLPDDEDISIYKEYVAK